MALTSWEGLNTLLITTLIKIITLLVLFDGKLNWFPGVT